MLKLIIILIYLFGCVTCKIVLETNVIQDNITINEEKKIALSYLNEYIIEIINLTRILEYPPRIHVSCKDCHQSNPVLVVVRQNKGVFSWELPFESNGPNDKNPTLLYETGRTLCPYDALNFNSSDDDGQVSLALSTSSPWEVVVTLLVSVEEDFILKLNTELSVVLTPSTPRFFAYHFNDDEVGKSVLLRVNAYDDKCLTVSVQHIKCPVFDLETNVGFEGSWQSVTRSGGFPVHKDNFPNGFFVVFVMHSNDEICKHEMLQSVNREKNVTVTVLPGISKMDYIIGVTFVIALLLGLSVFFCIVSLIYINRLRTHYAGLMVIQDDRENPGVSSIQPRPYRSASPLSNDGVGETISVRSDSSCDDSDIDRLDDINSEKVFIRSKGILYVSDLSQKLPKVLNLKSQLYLWYLVTVFVFYFLPVVQLVITYQKVLLTTGNQNLCYYNFLCAHPLGMLSDFNHVFTNIGYIVLGLLFIFLTWQRQKVHRQAAMRNRDVDQLYGVPQHFGLFYSMGLALAMEGVMSACYHVCPNRHNFQFDTSFMYIISTMCMLKIYHTRHPDVSARAYATFFVLAVTIFLGMCGVLYGTFAYWSVFTFVHLATCFLLSVNIYYLGAWRIRDFNCRRVLKEFYVRIRGGHFRAIFPTYPYRFLIILLANVVNWVVAILGPMYKFGDFASYLLFIFMANLALYTFFYIIMKLFYKEKIGKTPWCFIVLSLITWSCSMYFFVNKATSWKLSPAESRQINRPCSILNFYDTHDIWHFLSAFSMFFSFMVLLTLDDDLIDVRRKDIQVF